MEDKNLTFPRAVLHEDFTEIGSGRFENGQISIQSNGLEMEKDQVDRMLYNADLALSLIKKINGGEIPFWGGNPTFYIDKKGMDGLMSNFYASYKFLKEDDQSQTAAIVHEYLHGLQEDRHESEGLNYNEEAIPLLAEFLFCGDKRKVYFAQLTEGVKMAHNQKFHQIEGHVLGWAADLKFIFKHMGKEFDIGNINPDDIMVETSSLREISEEEKIEIIKALLASPDQLK